jgi:hypothetical protein
VPECRIEVLIPDFKGSDAALRTVLDARPDVLNHNIETVPRIFRQVRAGGRYDRSLELLDRARRIAPDIPTKSGLMVGIGEEWDEVVATIGDLRRAGAGILTSAVLRPSPANLPMVRYYHPDEFAEIKRLALELGFLHAECGPLVRSSYHAREQARAYDSAVGARRRRPCGEAGFGPRKVPAAAGASGPEDPPLPNAVLSFLPGSTGASSPRPLPETPGHCGGARAKRGRLSRRDLLGPAGAGSAMSVRGCSCSAWRRRRTARTGRVVSSPGMARAGRVTSSCARCIARASPARRHPCAPTTA